jgi:putative acetyltransferase
MSVVSIRSESEADHAAVRTVNEKAFERRDEANLVDRLRSNGDLVLSQVAMTEKVVGYIAFSRLHVEGATAGESLERAQAACRRIASR